MSGCAVSSVKHLDGEKFAFQDTFFFLLSLHFNSYHTVVALDEMNGMVYCICGNTSFDVTLKIVGFTFNVCVMENCNLFKYDMLLKLPFSGTIGDWVWIQGHPRIQDKKSCNIIKSSSIPVIWTTESVPHSELHFSMRVWPHRLALCLSTDMFQKFQSLF